MGVILFAVRHCTSILRPAWMLLSWQMCDRAVVYGRMPKMRTCTSSVSSTTRSKSSPSRIRNIGIVAHIDAGKTTTTERMLFYAGFSRSLGDVDDGDTITDYMEQERARGITITSAAVTFDWCGHLVNLIDTPGHVDFSMEVERCLRVLDGAVTVLDASAGVEAQTLTVWRQADRHAVPRIVYLNKMDMRTANIQLCLDSIVKKFGVKPLLTQLPLLNSRFVGVLDLLTMDKVLWTGRPEDNGRTFHRTKLQAVADGELWERASLARIRLIEDLADLDERIADKFLSSEGSTKVDEGELRDALRRVTLERKAVPIVCGSSYTNVGVQLLLDAIVNYLPSPEDINRSLAPDQTCALVFKILHDKQMGRLAFTRIYAGSLRQGQTIYDVNQRTSERPTKLMRAFADEFRPISTAEAGDIVILGGTKNVVTGDTLVATSVTASTVSPLVGIRVPPPVFFCSIEAASLAHQKPMEAALEQLRVEDPSLGVKFDSDTGQTIVSGLGELHMEILKDRLLKEYKVQSYFGELQVAYREVVTDVPCQPLEEVYDKTLASSRQQVNLRMSLEKSSMDDHHGLVRLARTKDNQENLSKIRPEHLTAVNAGVRSALSVGPLLGCPVTADDLILAIHWLNASGSRATLSSVITTVASQCTYRLLTMAAVRLSEPLMILEIVLLEDDGCLHGVLGDLSSRRARILDVHDRSDAKVVRALVPLADSVDYSTVLRTITSGKATFTMEFHSYSLMNEHDQLSAINRIKGYL